MPSMTPMYNTSVLLGLLEIPFLVVALFYSWRTASAMQGGIFGRGMGLMAGGLLVMAIGHVLMLLDNAFGIDLLQAIFGSTLGDILWVIALATSWGLTGTGFHSIYKASRA
ncbi:MAG TPA: hypothetical protein VKV32_02060 [Stellaceae bacterium]|nr:hypothetical protein [Stellaceae bacterium]